LGPGVELYGMEYMEYSVHPPNPFLKVHGRQLLPAWSVPISSVVIVLQPSQVPLLHTTKLVEQEKARLRQQLLNFGANLVRLLSQSGYLVEVFDPRSGLPTSSLPGNLHLDDLALIQSLLGYPARHQGQCRVMSHPIWGAAVYPGIIISAASPEVVQEAVQEILSGFTCSQGRGA
jgi:hypothetical protein